MSRSHLVLLAGLLVGTLVGAAAPVWAAEQVAIRAWPHADFARLVFDWKSPVAYTAKIEGRSLSVTFERDLETSFGDVQANLADHVGEAALGEDERTVRFTLKGDYELRHFVADGSVVLDLLEGSAAVNSGSGTRVPVRVGVHDKFSRVVFDWPSVVDYQLEDSAGSVTLRFSRPATLDLAAIESDPPRDIASARQADSDEGTVVTLEIAAGSRVRHFRDGFKVVLDVQHGAAPKAETIKVAQVPEPAEDNPPAPPAPSETVAPAVAAPESEARVELPLATAAADAPVHVASAAQPASAHAQAGEAADHSQATGAPTALAPTSHGEPSPAAPGHGAEAPAEAGGGHVAEIGKLEVYFTRAVDGGTLSFPFQRHTGAAAFRRGGQLWLVFDTPAEVDTQAIFAAAQDVVLGVEEVAADGALVLRLETIPGFNPTLDVDGTEWLVNIRPQSLEPKVAIDVAVASDPDGGSAVVVPMGAVGRQFTVADAAVGDEILVVTSKTVGMGVSKHRSYVGFKLLGSAQGVAVVALRDGVAVTADKHGVAIGMDGGLAVTSEEEREQIRQAVGGADVVPRAFDFEGWRGADGTYAATKQALQQHVSTTGGDERNVARLDLAKFYFGHGQPERALAVLDAVTRESAPLGRSPEFKALRGAAAYLMNRPDLAAGDLADRRLDEEPEIGVWRSALAADRGDWLGAARGLQDSELYVQRYPDDLRVRFSLLGADAALRIDDPNGALAWLESLEGVDLSAADAGLQNVLRGKILAANGHFDEALEKYDAAIDGDDRKSRALAMFERANLLLEAEEADAAKILGDLDRLRFAWRGDDLEFNVLRRLGELQIESEEYRGGLKTLKRAAANFPEHPEAEGLTDLMQTTFTDLYLHGDAAAMPAVRAIAIFNEFRELTPTGNEGDEMIRRLADRLVSVDLLDQAVELLAHQMEFRVEGADKANVGTRLAILQLMDRRPEEALEALRDSEVSGMTVSLVAERRLLQARSYAEMGLIDKALERIGLDSSVEADRLRADIFTRTLDWPRAVEVLTRLVGAAPAPGQTLDPGRSVLVLNLAVALNLANNRSGLDGLRARFGAAMAATEFAYDFRVIASEDTNSRELRNAMSRVAAVDDFKAFMEGYRARLAQPAESAPLVN